MTTTLGELVDVSVSRWKHCISGTVWQAWLLADGADSGDTSGIGDRKLWIERRLKELDAVCHWPSQWKRSSSSVETNRSANGSCVRSGVNRSVTVDL